VPKAIGRSFDRPMAFYVSDKKTVAAFLSLSRRDFMENIRAQFVGVEFYFENLERARKFYIQTMGLEVSDQQDSEIKLA
jgi:hypothetical protein